MYFQTFGPHEEIPENVFLPNQTHGTHIIEIVTGKEDISDCDG